MLRRLKFLVSKDAGAVLVADQRLAHVRPLADRPARSRIDEASSPRTPSWNPPFLSPPRRAAAPWQPVTVPVLAPHRRRVHLTAQDGQPIEDLLDGRRVAVEMERQRCGLACEPDWRDVETYGP